MEALIDLLLAWIGTNTGYRVDDIPPPAIVLMSPQQLTLEYYTDARSLVPVDGIDDRVMALYAATDGAHGTIYALAPGHIDGGAEFEDPTENPLFREVLLHEMVHHVQWQSGTADEWDCQSFGEREAYTLGGRYLKQTGTTDPLPNRMFWAQMYARC